MTIRVLQPEYLGPDATTPIEQLNEQFANASTAEKTPLFICTLESCYRLLPDKARLVTHRQKDHSLAAPDANLWQEMITWPEVKKTALAVESVAVAQKRLKEVETLKPAEPEVDIYAFEDATSPKVDHVKASYLPLAPPKPRKSPPPKKVVKEKTPPLKKIIKEKTSPAAVVPQKRVAEEQLQKPEVEPEVEEEYVPPPAAIVSSPYDTVEEEPTESQPAMTTQVQNIEMAQQKPDDEMEVEKPPHASLPEARKAFAEIVEPFQAAPLTVATPSEVVTSQPVPAAVYKPSVVSMPMSYSPTAAPSLPASLSALLASHAASIGKPQPLSYERPAHRVAAPKPTQKGTAASTPSVKAVYPPPEKTAVTGPRRTPPPPLPVVAAPEAGSSTDEVKAPASEAASRAKPASAEDIQSILARLKAPPR